VKQDNRIEWILLAVLVAFGVLGRWFQVQWNVTPTAAIALFAGFLFSRRSTALAIPLMILAISNLILDSYQFAGEMLAVYASFLLPVVFGRLLRRKFSVQRLIAGTLASSTLFFLTTNFAVWVYRRGEVYADSLAGLLACYEAGLPFFRWMLAGDIFFVFVVFGVYALATAPLMRQTVRVPIERRDH
jgi:hypothetical protein